MPKRRIFTGARFGKLVIVARIKKEKWQCVCDCGQERIVYGRSLVSGDTVSCGCYRSEMMRKRQYNPNTTDEERELSLNRDLNPKNIQWRGDVYKRDLYSCQVCGDDFGRNLVAHHKDGYHWCRERRYDISNGVTSCRNCHNEFHHLYGSRNNTEQQWDEYCFGSRREKPLRMEIPKVDISGIVFRYLTVLSRCGSTSDGHARFLCRCRCGNEKLISGSSLRRGIIKSCGCMKGALISESKRRISQ